MTEEAKDADFPLGVFMLLCELEFLSSLFVYLSAFLSSPFSYLYHIYIDYYTA